MAAAEPYDRPRDYIARRIGLGRPVLWSLAATTLVSTVAAVAAGGWALHVTRREADAVQRYVVYLDAGMAPVAQARIDSAWTPPPGAWLDFARRWTRELRNRPTDMPTFEAQRRELIWTTDARAYDRLQPVLKRADDELRNTAVDITSVSANLKESGRGRAIVFVRWTEQARAAAQPPTAWTATLTLAYQEPKAQAQMERNPLGIFVTDFQLSQETK